MVVEPRESQSWWNDGTLLHLTYDSDVAIYFQLLISLLFNSVVVIFRS